MTKYLKYKNEKLKYSKLLGTLDIIIKLNYLEGVQHISAILAFIQFQSEDFVSELEQGVNVEIPSYLSLKILPYSFRYYDPVIKIIQTMVSPGKVRFFNLQTSFIRYFEQRWINLGQDTLAQDYRQERIKFTKN